MCKKITLIVLAFFASIFLVACGKSPDVTANAKGTKIGETIKIGVNMELTGAVAAYGKSEQNGIKLAVDEINKAGGVDGKKIELVTKDNKSENAEASTSSTNLAIQSNVNAIVGPSTSGAVAAASLVSQKTGVPLITPSGTQDDLTVDANGVKKFVFRTTFKDSYQGEVLAAYSYNNLNAKKVVLYYDNASDYAKGIADEFKRKYKGQIVTEATFASGDKDYQSALTKFKDLDYDAVVMPGYYTETGIITKQARDLGIDKQSLDLTDSVMRNLLSLQVKRMLQMSTMYQDIQQMLLFLTRHLVSLKHMRKLTKLNQICLRLQPTILFIWLQNASKGAKTSVDIADNLANLKNFVGVTGKMTIDKDHNPIKAALMVKRDNGEEVSAEAVEIEK